MRAARFKRSKSSVLLAECANPAFWADLQRSLFAFDLGVPVFGELDDKPRRLVLQCIDTRLPSGACQGNIEKAALLSQWEVIGLWHRELQYRVVNDLAWKTHQAFGDVEKHHIVSLEAFCGMGSRITELKLIAIGALPAVEAGGLILVITAQEHDGDFVAVGNVKLAIFGGTMQLPKIFLDALKSATHRLSCKCMKSGSFIRVGGFNGLFYLDGILLDEVAGCFAQNLRASERFA